MMPRSAGEDIDNWLYSALTHPIYVENYDLFVLACEFPGVVGGYLDQ